MSEDFKNHLASVKLGESETENNETEMVTDLYTGESIPKDADLSEEASGELASEDHAEDVKKAEPIVREDNEKGFMCVFMLPCDVKEAIEKELTRRAETDANLAKNIAKENKSFAECYKFIEQKLLDIVMGKHSNERVMGLHFSDEDTYALAEYYFNDDSIEKEQARQAELAKKKAEQKKTEEKSKKTKKGKEKKGSTKVVAFDPQPPTPSENKTETKPQQLSLFDF